MTTTYRIAVKVTPRNINQAASLKVWIAFSAISVALLVGAGGVTNRAITQSPRTQSVTIGTLDRAHTR